ncbi:hypothetical protein CC1G_06276 [Coprinopsis cinerea okayama7|uniref:Methyltransferase domain-containing protein n=1 Tax=Coprinopsis cinerea (strain Okayama-7 / 130 / ATCC MYA-4618 / FGSC 9003) TaxID=240176 RepID=A8NTB8_COPC7|nr:hypothetical protein CC1G_06276 [Coprinopsis cinerea okayama7\|eukprot:XP_001836191.2 hypothetical protein CC1G_06276 [Coprinopsis cinerea okayama7\
MPGSNGVIIIDRKERPPLDESLYDLENDPEALDFFKSQTGIQDNGELRKHILNVQGRAYDVHGYPCIRNFSFLKLKISRLPAYPAVLDLLKQRQDPILLDLGCCFGNDLRKAVADGWPVQGAIGSDLRQDFWESGHELFRTTPNTFPARFLDGDIFDPGFINPPPPIPLTCSPPGPLPRLTDVESLTPLQGHISAIHTSSFFHLFSEELQSQAARLVGSLLSPLQNSIIFGCHVGRTDKGFREESMDGRLQKMFCHSPESWKEVWDGGVFKKGTVQVEARLRPTEVPMPQGLEVLMMMDWSVVRL